MEVSEITVGMFEVGRCEVEASLLLGTGRNSGNSSTATQLGTFSYGLTRPAVTLTSLHS